MDLFNDGPSFDNSQVQAFAGINNSQIAGASAANSVNGHAVLFLFRHKQIPNQVRRPHVYNFDGEFRNDMQEFLAESLSNPAMAYQSHMPKSLAAKHAILPRANGQLVETSRLSDRWTFVLMVDKANGGGPFATVTAIPSRMLYRGWIANDEGAALVGARWIPNNNAVLTITHHTILTVNTVMGQSGVYNQVQTTGDYDYASANVMKGLERDGAQLYSLNPADVSNSITVDPLMGTFNSAPGMAQLGNTVTGETIETPSELASPTYHLSKIVRSVGDAIRETRRHEIPDVFGDTDMVTSQISALMQSQRNVPRTDAIKPDEPISIGQLFARFGPALDIQVIVPNETPNYGLTDPATVSKRNIFTSLISTSIPSLLADYAVADVRFRYASYLRPDSPDGLFCANDDRGCFKWFDFGGLYQMSSGQQKSTIAMLERSLRKTVFAIVQSECGDFDVMVSCSLIGSTLVNLTLKDENGSLFEDGYVETNNLLGGINSPLVGTSSDLSQNSQQMHGVIADICSPETSGVMSGGLLDADGSNPLF